MTSHVTPSCASCHYALKPDGPNPDAIVICRRSPPVGNQQWPQSILTGWCGEYAPMPLEASQKPGEAT